MSYTSSRVLGHLGHSVHIGFMQIMKGIHDLKVMGSSSSYVILITVFSSTGWIHKPSCAFEYQDGLST